MTSNHPTLGQGPAPKSCAWLQCLHGHLQPMMSWTWRQHCLLRARSPCSKVSNSPFLSIPTHLLRQSQLHVPLARFVYCQLFHDSESTGPGLQLFSLPPRQLMHFLQGMREKIREPCRDEDVKPGVIES